MHVALLAHHGYGSIDISHRHLQYLASLISFMSDELMRLDPLHYRMTPPIMTYGYYSVTPSQNRFISRLKINNNQTAPSPEKKETRST